MYGFMDTYYIDVKNHDIGCAFLISCQLRDSDWVLQISKSALLISTHDLMVRIICGEWEHSILKILASLANKYSVQMLNSKIPATALQFGEIHQDDGKMRLMRPPVKSTRSNDEIHDWFGNHIIIIIRNDRNWSSLQFSTQTLLMIKYWELKCGSNLLRHLMS